jgi:hypothetical protein
MLGRPLLASSTDCSHMRDLAPLNCANAGRIQSNNGNRITR